LYNFYKWFSFWTANDSPFELQMNIICYKAHIFQTLNHALTNSLIAVVIIHSLSETYSTSKTILLSTPEDKLSTDAIINYILSRSQKVDLVSFHFISFFPIFFSILFSIFSM